MIEMSNIIDEETKERVIEKVTLNRYKLCIYI